MLKSLRILKYFGVLSVLTNLFLLFELFSLRNYALTPDSYFMNAQGNSYDYEAYIELWVALFFCILTSILTKLLHFALEKHRTWVLSKGVLILKKGSKALSMLLIIFNSGVLLHLVLFNDWSARGEWGAYAVIGLFILTVCVGFLVAISFFNFLFPYFQKPWKNLFNAIFLMIPLGVFSIDGLHSFEWVDTFGFGLQVLSYLLFYFLFRFEGLKSSPR